MEAVKKLFSLTVNESTIEELVKIINSGSSKGSIRFSDVEGIEILYLIAESVQNLDGKFYSTNAKFIYSICQVIQDYIDNENDKHSMQTSYSTNSAYQKALFILDILISSKQSIDKFRNTLKPVELGKLVGNISSQLLKEKEFVTQELEIQIICKICMVLFLKHDKRIDIVCENIPEILRSRFSNYANAMNIIKNTRKILNEININNSNIKSFSIDEVVVTNNQSEITYSCDWIDWCNSTLHIQVNETIDEKSNSKDEIIYLQSIDISFKQIRNPHIDVIKRLFEFLIEESSNHENKGKYSINFISKEELLKFEKILCDTLTVSSESIRSSKYGSISTKTVTDNYLIENNSENISRETAINKNTEIPIKNTKNNNAILAKTTKSYQKSSQLELTPIIKKTENNKQNESKSSILNKSIESTLKSDKSYTHKPHYKKITPNKLKSTKKINEKYEDSYDDNDEFEEQENDSSENIDQSFDYSDDIDDIDDTEYEEFEKPKKENKIKQSNKMNLPKQVISPNNGRKAKRNRDVEESFEDPYETDIDETDNSIAILLADLKAMNEKRAIKMRNKRLKAASDIAKTHMTTYQEEISEYLELKTKLEKVQTYFNSTMNHFTNLKDSIEDYRKTLEKNLGKSRQVYDNLNKDIARIKNDEKNEYNKLKNYMQDFKRGKVEELQTKLLKGNYRRN